MFKIVLTVVYLITGVFAQARDSSDDFDDPFLKELEILSKKEEDLEKRRVKFFFKAKPYISLKTIPIEPNELLNYSKEYISLKKPLIEPATKFDFKSYISLKKIPKKVKSKKYSKLKKVGKRLKVIINKSRQRMFVYLNNRLIHTFKVSTARRGYWTPNGIYRPYSLERMHYSRKYHNSPMPWSVFFKGGYAIHGTYSTRRLGRPASHGCVRVHPRNAKRLYHLIRKVGKHNTKIIIKG